MAGSRISWSDVRALYDTLNTAQTRFSQTRTTAPSNGERHARQSDITTLKNEIENLRNVSYVGTQATFSNFTAPRASELMKRVPLEEIRSKLDTINGICAYNGADYTSNNSYRGANYTSNNSYNGADYTSNNSYNSSNYSSNNSQRSSYYSSNDAQRSSYYSSNNAQRSSDYSSNNSNRSSNYSGDNGNRSSNYSSNYTYYTANYSSNNGVRSSNYGSNNGNKSAYSSRGAYGSRSSNRSGAGRQRS